MSSAVSARYGVVCPTCGADPFKPCRSRTKHRVTDTHAARIEAAYPRCLRCGLRRETHPIETCHHFTHTWHGFPCNVTICNCPTAWTEPAEECA